MNQLEAAVRYITQGYGEAYWGLPQDVMATRIMVEMQKHGLEIAMPAFAAPYHNRNDLPELPSDNPLFGDLPHTMIGLHGEIGSGKDTVADHLIASHGFVRYNFGDFMKYALSVLYDVPISIFYDREKKEAYHPVLGCSPRTLMRIFGTDVCRKILPGIWLRTIEAALRRSMEQKVVIADVRFEDEAMFLNDHGGKVFVVERPNNPYSKHSSNHLSDQQLPDYLMSGKMLNDGTIADLASVVEHMLGLPKPGVVCTKESSLSNSNRLLKIRG